jgi:choline dehydrogenase-like flavoprotein
MTAMAEIQFAAGATAVMPAHDEGDGYAAFGAARAAIAAFDLRPRATTLVSAHVKGGCAQGPDARRGGVVETGRHHHLANLFVLDGSLFPTSVGANPQLTIYALAAKLATDLARRLRT